jgi:hypothetical protein
VVQAVGVMRSERRARRRVREQMAALEAPASAAAEPRQVGATT